MLSRFGCSGTAWAIAPSITENKKRPMWNSIPLNYSIPLYAQCSYILYLYDPSIRFPLVWKDSWETPNTYTAVVHSTLSVLVCTLYVLLYGTYLVCVGVCYVPCMCCCMVRTQYVSGYAVLCDGSFFAAVVEQEDRPLQTNPVPLPLPAWSQLQLPLPVNQPVLHDQPPTNHPHHQTMRKYRGGGSTLIQ